MLELSAGLPARALAALRELERRAVAYDGGRLKLEWGVLASRPGDRVQDLLWWDGETLLGFLGLYPFGAPTVELAGVVDPAARRQGIGSALLDAARPLIEGYERALLIVPRESAAGARLARRRGGTLDHSEHALLLSGAPARPPGGPQVQVREAVPEDEAVVVELLTDAFGWRPREGQPVLARDGARTCVVEVDGAIVGTARLSMTDGAGAVHGFAVAPSVQGRGIGRRALCEFCRILRADGARKVGLEVAVENERALGLYTSVGFAPVTTEDYYALPITGTERAVPPA